MGKSSKPTGLSITRSGTGFICSWKRAQDYNEQTFAYSLNRGAWNYVGVGKKDTSKTIWVNTGWYYPSTGSTLWSVRFAVKGKKKGKKYSDFSYYEIPIYAPNTPSVSASHSEELTNQSTFSWGTDIGDSYWQWWTVNAYQTMIVKECMETDGNRLNWAGAAVYSQPASGSVTITEDTSLFQTAPYSFTRWVRLQGRGPGGYTGWAYAKHVYAMPNKAANVKASANTNEVGGYTCRVTWDTTSNAAHPADTTTVQYTITTPAVGMSCPNGASWNDANVSLDVGSSNSAVFSIDDTLDTDQCLFVRVNTKHDKNITYGEAVLADVGYLATPGGQSGMSVDVDPDTHMVSITCANNSNVADSYVAVMYVPSTKVEDAFVVAIIPHGESQVTNVQCPDWGDQTPSFEAYAVVGEYTTETRSDGVTVYTINDKMRSISVLKKGGEIPVKPANVSVSQTAIPGTILVTWKWTWSGADSAEISWADHDDAWESTDEPQTYLIARIHKSKWNISGLETGIKWYVRVRLLSGDAQNGTYGPYSDPVSIDLSSAPNKPAMILSDAVITEDGELTASWVYSTTDGTGQAYAEICEATDTSEGREYGAYRLSADASVTYKDENGGEVVTGKSYFVRSGSGTYASPYIYTEVDKSDFYALTTDASVDATKTYYTRSGSGTSASPYVFTKVASPSAASLSTYYEANADPHTNGWYEFIQSVAHVESEQHVTINAKDAGWETGETYSLCVRVVSSSGKISEWSDPVSVMIAEPISCAITQTSLVSETVTEDGVSRTVNSLKAMPFTATVVGAGYGGLTSVAIERTEDYFVRRPDEQQYAGYEGENIAVMTYIGESQASIGIDDLIGNLDDGAKYRLVASVSDDLGQTDSDSIDFEVHWTHQAIIPEATAVTDIEKDIVKITVAEPTGYGAGDTCDIYRLSADRPVLIVKGAEFDTMYVDPYPTIGDYGGHLVVYMTANGDYITEDNELAMVELTKEESDYIPEKYGAIIDFDGGQIVLMCNIDVSNSWSKDFKETQYLGGSVQGDWNAAVSRKASVSTTMITLKDAEDIALMRRLAAHPGICHVRTHEGSNYWADVQVSESYEHNTAHRVASFSLSITRVDSERLDGMTYAQWQAENEDSQEEEEEEEE